MEILQTSQKERSQVIPVKRKEIGAQSTRVPWAECPECKSHRFQGPLLSKQGHVIRAGVPKHVLQSLDTYLREIVIICGVVCLTRGQREIEVSIMVVMVHGYKKSSWRSQQQKTKSSNIRDAHLTFSFFLPSLAKLHLNKNISSIGSIFLCDGFCQTLPLLTKECVCQKF